MQAAIHTPLASDETDLRKQDARCLPHRHESDCAIGFLLLLCGRCLRRCHAKVDGAVPRIDESFDQRGIFDVLLYDACDRVFVHLPALPASRLSSHGQAAHPNSCPSPPLSELPQHTAWDTAVSLPRRAMSQHNTTAQDFTPWHTARHCARAKVFPHPTTSTRLVVGLVLTRTDRAHTVAALDSTDMPCC